ncbi:MAG: type II secretion system major pseudopilin GspG [Candidatus Omnitrophica bacterium]|nr:type II secretion system major pseudopilin GspG [Candidatus Omnitrophota bacterium]
MKSKYPKRGVTLIELMLVIIIIGVLIAMVMPRLAGRSEQARKVAATADIESNIAMALDMYELDNGAYPSSLDDLMKKPPDASNWNGPYLKKKPKDPWGREYIYKYPADNNKDSYDLFSYGKDGSERGGDDITNWSSEEETPETAGE